MFSIATPISHLFKNDVDALMLAQHSDCLEFRDHSPSFGLEKQKLFHCELQPIHALCEEDFIYLKKIKDERDSLEMVSFHMATCFDDPVVSDHVFVSGNNKYSEAEMFENASKNFKRIKQILGPTINVAVENNNYYNTEAYEFICNPTFISRVVRDNDIFLLFDLAHAHVSSYNMNISYQSYCEKLPLDRIIQLHICKSGVNEKMAYDAHFLPDDEDFIEIEVLIGKCCALKYFTVEYYKEPKLLLEVLKKLKNLLNRYD
jgi:uncharacterized protein (UPF0276 family)